MRRLKFLSVAALAALVLGFGGPMGQAAAETFKLAHST